jgi:hypothetical protein
MANRGEWTNGAAVGLDGQWLLVRGGKVVGRVWEVPGVKFNCWVLSSGRAQFTHLQQAMNEEEQASAEGESL